MNLYKIINREGDDPIVKHDTIEGWIEIEGITIFQCLADESDPKKVTRFALLKQIGLYPKWVDTDGQIYDKIQIVPED
jgi:hypothetical protein